ncbi:hypothetical protein [Rhodococcus qingshengii]|uniref:hypothetical protein n=1 Tax=Rhodococcus qingshengii TaxID=334542 RepID=UPI003017B7BC
MPETDNENSDGALELITETGAPHRVGGFRYHRHGDRWQCSDAVARMHGYTPGTVTPHHRWSVPGRLNRNGPMRADCDAQSKVHRRWSAIATRWAARTNCRGLRAVVVVRRRQL